MPISPAIRRAQLKLLSSRMSYADDHAKRLVNTSTASDLHNFQVETSQQRLFGNMLNEVKEAGRLFHDSTRVETWLKNHAQDHKLTVKYNAGVSPHFDPRTQTVSLMDRNRLDQAAHEMRHATDHITKQLDFGIAKHRLHSELRAFTMQKNVALETMGHAPPEFENRTPTQMAKSYEGKVDKGYVGTLEESTAAVHQWWGNNH
ncbi:MAG: hypothetical protein AAGB12_16290 [Pseudomonadota bacterium]